MHVLAELQPLDPASGTRTMMRVSSVESRTVNGLNSQRWMPAIVTKPTISIDLFQGDFSSAIAPGSASLDIAIGRLDRLAAMARSFLWAGAPAKLYAGNDNDSWPWATVLAGRVTAFTIHNDKLSITIEVETEPFAVKVPVATYAGTGGIEGGADLKGKAKPLCLGAPRNVEPVLINATDSVLQFSSGGPLKAVETLYERGSAFTASTGDYANYAALVAATIPPGKWATCLAYGLIRLGAPPFGVITGDVQGDYTGSAWARLPGAIIQRICALAGISSGLIDTTSLDAMDAVMAALPGGGMISLFIAEQRPVIDLARDIARSCNYQAGIGLDGALFVTTPSFSSPSLTLDTKGRRMPKVLGTLEANCSMPFKRIQMGAARCWRVHSLEEIAFDAPLVDRGVYDAAETYREGQMVTLPDDTRWLFVGATPLAGSTPAAGNANWQYMGGGAGATFALSYFPAAADSIPGQTLHRTDLGDRLFIRIAGDGLVSIGGSDITIGGSTIYLPPWREVSDFRMIQALADAALAQADATRAITEAAVAQADATAALADIDKIVSDNVLSADEKPRIKQDYDVIIAEQSGIDAQATALSITTEKTAYDTAAGALTTYLATLTTPTLWSSFGGVTTIVGTTFRAKFSDVYTTRQVLLDKIAAALKVRADAAQSAANTAQADATAALNVLAAIASDNVLSKGEKPQVEREYDALYSNWYELDAKATALGVASVQASAASTAMSALYSYLAALSPAWNNAATDTTIVGATFASKWQDAYDAVAALQAAIQGIPGIDALTVSPLALIGVPCTPGGVPTGSIPGFALKVFKGTTDVTASASYTIDSQTGVSGVTHSGAGAFTGPTSFASEPGYVEITVSKDGVDATTRQVFGKLLSAPGYARQTTTFSLPGSTSYVVVATLTMLAGSNGTFLVAAGAGYVSGAGPVALEAYIEYSLNGGSSWSTLSGSSVTGGTTGGGIPNGLAISLAPSGSSIGLSTVQTVKFRVLARQTNTDSMSAVGTPPFEIQWNG